METITPADAKINLEALLDQVQTTPVMIFQEGRAIAVLMSATTYEEQQATKFELLRREIQKGLDDVKRGRVVSAKQAFAAVRKKLKRK